MNLSGWGRHPVYDAVINAPRSETALIEQLQAGCAIARGNGRAYGDSAVSLDNTIHMRHFNRMISFDKESGTLVAEAGVLLADIISAFLPIGFFPYVTPGTKFVTLGGMLAADVHGKNHHVEGNFSNFVVWFEMINGSGTLIHCSRTENSEIFHWTLGGMGLTGIILRAAIRLRKVETSWIKQTTMAATNLEHAMALFEQSSDTLYSVAWIDCLSSGKRLGRSIVMLGEHAQKPDLTVKQREKPLAIMQTRNKNLPFNLPTGSLNRHSVRAFNALYYWNGQRCQGVRLTDWNSYFYPLDALLGWNKIYGRKGFVQFQCVLPLDQSANGLRKMIQEISKSGSGSFLAVLKRLGDQATPFSFPMQGYTLALDFPVNKQSLKLLDTLDQITLEHGGRFYLAKDARMSADTLFQSDDRVSSFVKMREELNLKPTFESIQAKRLHL